MLPFVLVTVLGLGLVAGCHKKVQEAAAPVDPAAAAPADTNAAATPTTAVAPEPEKPLDLAPVRTEIKTGDYDKAAQDLLVLQRLSPQLSPQQQTMVADQMRAFQRALASAVGTGDPKAIAAAQRLREQARHR